MSDFLLVSTPELPKVCKDANSLRVLYISFSYVMDPHLLLDFPSEALISF